MTSAAAPTRVSLGQCAVEIECRASELQEHLDFLLRDTRREGGEVQTRFVIDRRENDGYVVSRNGADCFTAATPGELCTSLVGEIIYHLIENNSRELLIHAACLVRDDLGILLPGVSGSGKSTLCAWLISRGFGYLTDELVSIDPDTFEVDAFTRPLNIKHGGMEAVQRRFGGDFGAGETLEGDDLAPRPSQALRCAVRRLPAPRIDSGVPALRFVRGFFAGATDARQDRHAADADVRQRPQPRRARLSPYRRLRPHRDRVPAAILRFLPARRTGTRVVGAGTIVIRGAGCAIAPPGTDRLYDGRSDKPNSRRGTRLNSKRLLQIALLALAVSAAAADMALFRDLASGEPREFADYREADKWMVVMVWASDCPVCNREVSGYSDFHLMHEQDDAIILGVSIDGEAGRDDAPGSSTITESPSRTSSPRPAPSPAATGS
ncbi:MAG: redoxin domain-containing protein [Gammaproteobacteria bacterium]|nr:redoxin domain-containing protein [Gammaproteobacteria bacterium]